MLVQSTCKAWHAGLMHVQGLACCSEARASPGMLVLCTCNAWHAGLKRGQGCRVQRKSGAAIADVHAWRSTCWPESGERIGCAEFGAAAATTTAPVHGPAAAVPQSSGLPFVCRTEADAAACHAATGGLPPRCRKMKIIGPICLVSRSWDLLIQSTVAYGIRKKVSNESHRCSFDLYLNRLT